MNTIKELARTIIVVMILVAGVSLVSAWTAPTQAPPGGNVSAPVNVGALSQVKSGPLQVNGFRNIGNSIFDGSVRLSSAPTVSDGGAGFYGWGRGNGTWPPPIGGQNPYAINDHTGLTFSAHSAYGGIRFFNQGYPNIAAGQMVMAITNDSVGIGTAAPTQKLDVAGDIKTNAGIWLGGVRKTTWPSGGGGNKVFVPAYSGLNTAGLGTDGIYAPDNSTIGSCTGGVVGGTATCTLFTQNGAVYFKLVNTSTQADQRMNETREGTGIQFQPSPTLNACYFLVLRDEEKRKFYIQAPKNGGSGRETCYILSK